VVVGGGISGLAGARALADAGHDVAVLEAGDRLGGKIRTSDFNGVPVDEGADAFLARVPHAVELCKRLGMFDDLVSPGTGSASLWLDGVLKPIPPGLVLGVPVDFGPLRESGVLSAEGMARAELEPTLPGAPVTDDVTIGDLVRARYGAEVHERLVDPLLGGINAGRTEELSLEIGAAQLAAVARKSASLTEGLRAVRAANPPDPNAAVFYAPRRGMAALVDALAASLAADGVAITLGTSVASIERVGDAYRVATGDGDVLEADRVLIAAPAPIAAGLITPLSAAAGGLLGLMTYASVTLVTLAYRDSDVARPLAGSGFLVPRTEGRFLTACSVFSNKWPHLAVPDVITLRASVGRSGDERALALDDDALVERVDAELGDALGVKGQPLATRVSHWPSSFPQFPARHLARVADLEAALATDAPGVGVAGAHLRGVGIPTCIGAAAAAAVRLT
jgi:oxygen-dependent protoporphyrinogen oxidase